MTAESKDACRWWGQSLEMKSRIQTYIKILTRLVDVV